MRNIIPLILNERKMSQRQLAREIGKRGRKIDYAHLNRIICQKQIPSLMLACAISEVLGYKIQDIFFPGEREIFRNGNADN